MIALYTFLKRAALSALLLSALTIGMGCNKKLDLSPETALSDASFWKTPADLLSACTTLYNSLPGMAANYQDNYSDISFGAAANTVSDGSRIAPATAAEWADNYTLIRRSNTILEKSAGVKGDEVLIKKAKGEASFFRAWAYFELVKRYGDVPLILRTFDIQDTLATAHRTPRAQVIKAIYSDLDFAAANCPDAAAQPAAEYGRITAGAALAFKSRVALFEGTREKFFNYGTPTSDLTIAIDAAGKVMANARYGLYQNASKPDSSYFYLFQLTADGAANKENILVRLYGQDMTNSISYTNVSRDLEQALISPTRTMLDLYLYKDGLPIGKSLLQQEQTNTTSEFANRDPRAGITVFNRSLWYISGRYVPNFDFTKTGYKLAKWFKGTDWNNKRSFTDFAIIRYAEVLLNYAEARYELNGSITDDDLNLTINRIRARNGAGAIAPLTNVFVNSNGLNMRDEIRRERSVELAFEGFRYWDLLRWKTAEVQLPAQVLGIKYFPAEMKITSPSLTTDGYLITQPAAKRAFNPAKDYLWPIPTSELGYNPNMVQNPGW
ncbi:RagB/SusD family nutrient uptake outer membrane protein [Mucilaginibacter sabulilitoris]|uniref:RagB/SusD family nutrient uptake outer membrane protein n=1 Tax=Mucilaginibacter sabulilitoris TaxID=1173583 RepID=A0ABZ0TUS7_9SPHI|nr:RagB/SusD family nutrient uptake outer membrane protein [Mucilaginibacter sabulilitoris]WPU95539.1 RagB/SusD family nutrient uptake outer membrane protein [Mucilaginibacter sabulilitoris]